ncbi:hypothetical protein TKK_0003654 [Trichogramma kaykai]|uniref:Tyr recombinase domain-containing protein n=1 Tax=Trichogramma kaykai TaxID=54128 RepID=A0ABD2XP46_9HYME
MWSMLRSTLSTNENIDIRQFQRLKNFIKNNSKGYKPKKSEVFQWSHIMKFINDAPDEKYFAHKLTLIFGICGTLRCDEMIKLRVDDVKDLNNNMYLVAIRENKNDYAGQFIIGKLFYKIVKKYISIRPKEYSSERFFVQYHNGKCTRQPIGKHWIGQVPYNVAVFLKLDQPKKYTGHCTRRTSASLLSESGATMQMIKQAGLIHEANKNRVELIPPASGEPQKNNAEPIPSTSVNTVIAPLDAEPPEITNEYAVEDVPWEYFEEELESENGSMNQNTRQQNRFYTANRKRIDSSPPFSTNQCKKSL